MNKDDHRPGRCTICHEDKPVRHKNIYIIGSEGTDICMDCEKELLRFLEGRRRHHALRRKEIYKAKKKGVPYEA